MALDHGGATIVAGNTGTINVKIVRLPKVFSDDHAEVQIVADNSVGIIQIKASDITKT